MNPKYSNHPHRPPHIFIDDCDYFITGRILRRQKLLAGNRKQILLAALNKNLRKYNCRCHAWVILDNHYHLLIRIGVGVGLADFIKNLHSESARILNKIDGTKGRQVWYQYWDHVPRDETDFFKHFNYIHHNPVKHGYVKNQDDAKNFHYCSYWQWLDKRGKEWLDNCFEQYPIIDFTMGE